MAGSPTASPERAAVDGSRRWRSPTEPHTYNVEPKQLEATLRAARAALRAADRATESAAAVGNSQAEALSRDVQRAAERLVRHLSVLEARHRQRSRRGLR